MTSTRNKNMPAEYCNELKLNGLAKDYTLFNNSASGKAFTTNFPDITVLPGKRPRESIARNPIDIESALFGINSTNLVKPAAPVNPQLQVQTDITFVNPRPVFMPEELVLEKNQRPFNP
jgi:hypothetical protein